MTEFEFLQICFSETKYGRSFGSVTIEEVEPGLATFNGVYLESSPQIRFSISLADNAIWLQATRDQTIPKTALAQTCMLFAELKATRGLAGAFSVEINRPEPYQYSLEFSFESGGLSTHIVGYMIRDACLAFDMWGVIIQKVADGKITAVEASNLWQKTAFHN